MAFTQGNDINILQQTDTATVSAGAGNDRYVLNAATLEANQRVTITDTLGSNVLQLVGGLEIVSSKVTSNALVLILNNGAEVTVLGADTFTFQTGGDAIAGTGGLNQQFAAFVTASLGLPEVPATGAAPVEGSKVTVKPDGGTDAGGGPGPVEPGDNQTFTLTTGHDSFTGGTGNDKFVAKVQQNANGEQANTLGTGDNLNGGAGTDTLQATVQAASSLNAGPASAIRAITKDIEVVEITALATNNAAGFGNVERVVIDAAELKGVQKIGSVQSNADLLIQNLTTRTNNSGDGVKDTDYANRKVTESVTIVYDHAGNSSVDSASDLTVLFDNDYLVCNQDLSSQARYWLLDQDAELADRNTTERLKNIDSNGLTFTLDGVAKEIRMSDAERKLATSHEKFVATLQEKLLLLQQQGDLPASMTLELDYSAGMTRDNVALEGGIIARPVPAIVLKVDGVVIAPTGFAKPEDTTGMYDVYGRFDNNQESECKVTSTIELEKVGRDGEGGVLTVGGMAGQDNGLTNVWNGTQHSQNQGVERFNITVSGDKTQNSSLAALQSTNNTLQEVNIKSAAGSEADLKIGNGNTVGAITNALKDVQTFNATEFVNDLTLNAHLSEEVVAKYLNRVDEQNNPAQDNVKFEYNFGAGNDALNLNISKANLDAAGTTTREDFVLNIDTGAGNDKVDVQIGNGVGGVNDHWYINNTLDRNLTINTGAGNDEVIVHGSGTWSVNLGTGSDLVYLADSERSSNNASQAVWVFNTADQVTALDSARALNNLESGANTAYTSLLGTQLTVNFRGIATTLKLNDANINTRLELNQVIKQAINGDAVLSQLLQAVDGPANTLVVKSYIDGAVDAGYLSVSLAAPAALSVSELAQYNLANGGTAVDAATALNQISAQVAAINASNAYASALANNGVADLAGHSSTHAGDSVVTLVADGNDVVVLSANDFNKEIVQLEKATGSNNKVTIVNLESADDVIQVKGANDKWITAEYATQNADGTWTASDLQAASNPAHKVFAGYWNGASFVSSGAEVDVVLAGAYVPPNPNPNPGQVDKVVVDDGESYDASTGAFNFILDFGAGANAWVATINGFGDDDTITVLNSPAGAASYVATNSATAFDYAYALADFSASWTITLGNQDAAFVTQVTASAGAGGIADTVQALGVVEGAWGADWLVGAA